MSEKDMLAPIVRALVGIPQEHLGVILDAINKIGGKESEFWRRRFARVLRESATTLIHVDHSRKLFIGPTRFGYLHRDLVDSGPTDYDISILELWPHEKQKNGGSIGVGELYEYLKENDMLSSCLSVRDGVEIQRKGADVFRRFFGSRSPVLWKSVGESRHGYGRNVPYLFVNGDRVEESFYSFDSQLGEQSPALRFPASVLSQ